MITNTLKQRHADRYLNRNADIQTKQIHTHQQIYTHTQTNMEIQIDMQTDMQTYRHNDRYRDTKTSMLPGGHTIIVTETRIVKQTDKQKDMKNGIINQQKIYGQKHGQTNNRLTDEQTNNGL